MKKSILLILVLLCFAPAAFAVKPPLKKTISQLRPGISKILYGETEGRKIYQYTLTNSRCMMMKVINYGGTITDIFTPDRDGKLGNVVLGFDSLKNYISKDNARMGAIRGRVTNRVADSKFTLDGKEYTVVLSKNGEAWGFNKRIWDIKEVPGKDSVALVLSYLSKDGEDGYPGNLNLTVTYTLTSNNALKIRYSATTDLPTPLVITSHSYFNLSGGKSADILNTELTVNAGKYLEADKNGVPTGNFADVKNSPFDFISSHQIGDRITDESLIKTKGYDVTYAFGNAGKLTLAATAYEPLSGRTMQIYTTEPGMIFYTGNAFNNQVKGKSGIPFIKHAAFCAETQHYPNSVNQPNFPTTIVRPGETFSSETVYIFGVRK